MSGVIVDITVLCTVEGSNVDISSVLSVVGSGSMVDGCAVVTSVVLPMLNAAHGSAKIKYDKGAHSWAG